MGTCRLWVLLLKVLLLALASHPLEGQAGTGIRRLSQYTFTFSPTSATPTTAAPSSNPTTTPTANPTTSFPTSTPTMSPTWSPSNVPTTSTPTTCNPTNSPTMKPTRNPTTVSPTTRRPTNVPSQVPTGAPSNSPTHTPTGAPTTIPTASPSASPTASPTFTPNAVLLTFELKPPYNGEDDATRKAAVLQDMQRVFGSSASIHVRILPDNVATVLILENADVVTVTTTMESAMATGNFTSDITTLVSTDDVHRKDCPLSMKGETGQGGGQTVTEREYMKICPKVKYEMSLGLLLSVCIVSGGGLLAMCAAACYFQNKKVAVRPISGPQSRFHSAVQAEGKVAPDEDDGLM